MYNNIKMPPPLTNEEQQALLEKMPDLNSRNTLIERNLRLVAYIAHKFSNTGIMEDELFSIGTMGLIKAIDNYNLDKGVKLATYATRCIENEILMFLRRSNRQSLREISIETPISTDDSNDILLKDMLLDPKANLPIQSFEDTSEFFERINVISNCLYEKSFNEFLLFLYMIGDKKQREIGEVMELSQSYISRRLKKLRKYIAICYKKSSLKKDSDVYFFKVGDNNFCFKLKGFPLITKELESKSFAEIADILIKS